MKLLVLYGPPAVGKLTVAKEIIEQTNFKLFDNHISIDFVEKVFERGHASFSQTVDAVRMLMFEEAAKANVDLLFTLVYAHPVDDSYMKEIIESVQKYGAEVILVQLTCSKEELNKRVTNPSRLAKNAISDTTVLMDLLNDYDLFSPYPDFKSHTINTDSKSAADTATEILKYL